MRSRKIAVEMISRMSKQSLKSSRMRNIFVTVTIVLTSALPMYQQKTQMVKLQD